jgi:hypothetical protein
VLLAPAFDEIQSATTATNLGQPKRLPTHSNQQEMSEATQFVPFNGHGEPETLPHADASICLMKADELHVAIRRPIEARKSAIS